jgi:DNA-binding transcriptional MerR regulator
MPPTSHAGQSPTLPDVSISALPVAGAAALPSKLFFRIGEVASLVGVEPHVLRYWEREFRSIRPTKSAKGQRVYSRKDVENLLRVRDLLYRDGFTIAGAKKRLQRGGVEPEVATATDASRSDAEDREADDQEPTSSNDTQPDAPPVRTRDHEQDHERQHARASEPESGPRSHDVRVKLTALRAEVEAFLGELEGERA